MQVKTVVIVCACPPDPSLVVVGEMAKEMCVRVVGYLRAGLHQLNLHADHFRAERPGDRNLVLVKQVMIPIQMKRAKAQSDSEVGMRIKLLKPLFL